ncbi:MAG: cadherin-like domain-containing protein, partial [Betaproteobacteria bacterium]|nr:cadherin-like domain-containing protein [Betaproteobacteria bacterium]
MFLPKRLKVSAGAAAIALALAAASFSAHAVLERAGPVSAAPSVGGFPSWFQDTSGLALEFCDPKNASEVAGGWCLLLPANIPAVPEAFPNNFFIEHFYWAGTASMTTNGGAKALLVLAQEASFANGFNVIPGDQVVFGRIRVKLTDVPVTGTYRFIHPFGEERIDAVAGQARGIFFTDDVGLNCVNTFDCSLSSRLGPFLLPSAAPGAAEMPPLTAANPTPDTDPAHFKGAFAPTPYPGTGAAYIADPGRIGPVTGSPLPNFIDSTGKSRNHNIFRIEGPPGSALGVDPATGATVDWIETTDFALMGRIFTGAMPGRISTSRASYAHNVAGQQKLDVYAKALGTTQGRLPTQPRPATIAPQMTFFDAPCDGVVDAFGIVHPPFSAPAGAVETQMISVGNLSWGQIFPVAIPSAVCVKDATARDAAGNIVPIFMQQAVSDEVTVSQAFYNPSLGSLTVAAASSDAVFQPTLTLAYGTFLGDLASGNLTVPGMIAPPGDVFVQSSALGVTKYQVSTGFAAAAPAPAGIPVAANDSYTFPMNSAAQVLAVLANDLNVAGGKVSLTSLPRLGTAVLNADGTVSFTPNLNATGLDAFTYTVTVGTQVSNTGSVSLDITPVNLAPTAANDAVNAIANKSRAIKVLANDTDPNGAVDIVAAVNVTQPVPAGASTSVAGGTVTFTAGAPGTYTFTYQAKDAGGLVSANTATVTVTVAAAESLSFTKAQYVVSKSRIVVSGT